MSRLFINLSQRLGSASRPWADYNLQRWGPGRELAAHEHEYFQIIHVLDGTLAVDWGGGPTDVGPGQVHLLPPGFAHQLRTRGGQRQFGLNCTPAPDERGILAALQRTFPNPTVLPADFPAVTEQLLSAPLDPTPVAALQRLQSLDQYALSLVTIAARPSGDRREHDLLDELRRRRAEPITVDDIARSLQTSRATLQRFCRRHFGAGVAHLHERLRLEHAAHLLLTSEHSITAVAQACGYPDLFPFSRAFHRVYGCAPTAYRKHNRGRDG